MSTPHEWAADLPDGPALLERAVAYTRGSLQLVAGTDPDAPTPCTGWSLVDLLQHMNDSLAAITTAARVGYVDLVPVRGEGGPELCRVLVERLKGRACALLAAWARHPGDGEVAVSDHHLQADLLAAAGSLEIAVHGWDVARACGADRPLPPALALDLLDVVPLLVGDADRPARFAGRLDVPVHARPSDKLLAALGRSVYRAGLLQVSPVGRGNLYLSGEVSADKYRLCPTRVAPIPAARRVLERVLV